MEWAVRISQRLQQINKMVIGEYDHIWDCCCDHGLLGMLLLQRRATPKVHFVDCVAPLMQQLTSELQRFSPHQEINSGVSTPPDKPFSLWQVHCIDVAALPLEHSDEQANHLIIIAGVGGELLVELVRSIVARHSHRRLEFILCPVHHNYYVRQSLAELGLSLQAEVLIEENSRFYEILHLSYSDISVTVPNEKDTGLTLTGSVMWQGLTTSEKHQARQYLEQTISHYQRIPVDKLPHKLQILAEYQHILHQLSD